MLDWHDLQVFVAAAELENFSAAAQELHLSQPAITQRIRSLEKQLGVQLFERQGRRVHLSEAGAYLLPLAKDLLRRSKRTEEMMQSLRGEVVGHLVIGCSTTTGKYLLPPLMARFCDRYPGVQATVRVGSRNRVLEFLAAGEVHLAFTSALTPRREVRYRQFIQDQVVLIAPSNHPWIQKEAIQPEELLQERLILREPGSGTYQAMEAALARHAISVDELHTVITVGNSEAIILAVEEGIGVGFVPKLAAQRCMRLGNIQVVPIVDTYMSYTIWMAENTMQPATAAQLHFLKLLKAEGYLNEEEPVRIGETLTG
jgi:DNA-binding transcriptional LysR family regulator